MTTLAAPVPYTPMDVVSLRADVYPAQVQFSFADETLAKARVLVTADKVVVLVDAQGAPRVAYEGRLDDYQGDRRTLIATTADGDVVVRRAGGCGCGSKLKGYKAYRRAVRMASR